MKRFTIFGSGFGLYGYLPAICGLEDTRLWLPSRYQKVVDSRSELRGFWPKIDWEDDAEARIVEADVVVLAQRPVDNFETALAILNSGHRPKVFIEKPPGNRAAQGRQLLEEFQSAGCSLRIGYIFRYLPWFAALRSAVDSGADKISIVWRFRAHHIANDLNVWKADPGAGGGVLHFFAIHLLACLADLKFINLDEARYELQGHSLYLRVRRSDNAEISVRVDMDSETNEFGILSDGSILSAMTDPFQEEPKTEIETSGQDIRVAALYNYLNDNTSDADEYRVYSRTNDLWSAVEEKAR